jgi:protein O-mannosyl-transferase
MNFKLQQKHLAVFIILMLTILILAVYWQVQRHQFIDYDDQMYVTGNYRIQSGINFKSITDTFTDIHTSNWHPLTMMSHMLDWQLFGDNAGGHHWTSVIIHIINTILLFLLFRNLTGAIWRSAFIAALFAIHPINVESVAWIAERKNVLSTFFWISTMLFYGWYVKNPSWKRYLLVILCFALGLMSKPMLVTLPFVLLLLDYWPLNRTAINTQNKDRTETALPNTDKRYKISSLLLEKVPLFVLTAISIGITFYAAQAAKAVATTDSALLAKRISNAIVSYGLYIKKLFWPIDLAAFYPLNFNIPVWHIVLAASLIIIITILACGYFRQYPYLPVGWFWYLGTLVPVIGIVQVGSQAMADRYAYVPCIGLFIIIAWGGNQILSKIRSTKIFTAIVFISIVIMFTIVSYNQVKIWKNTVTLFEDAIKSNSENYLAYNALGLAAAGQGDYEKALYYYYMALKINPKYELAYNNAGIILSKMGKLSDAIKCYEKAININIRSATSHHNLGIVLMLTNNVAEAISQFNKALELKPDYIDAHNSLGIALLKMGNVQEAIMHFNKALQLNPKDEEVRKNIKNAIAMQKKINKSVSE